MIIITNLFVGDKKAELVGKIRLEEDSIGNQLTNFSPLFIKMAFVGSVSFLLV